MPKLKNHPILERWLKTTVRHSRDSFRGMQASLLREEKILMPDFLGIGAPRAASTWLHSRLSEHPEIYLPHRKELHFFDAEEISGKYSFEALSKADRRVYATYFQRGMGLTRGEITPAYSCLPSSRVAQIARFLPDVRVVYILRNPIDRAWSGIRRRCWYGKGKKADQLPASELMKIASTDSLLIRGDYRRNIGVWENEIPSDRIHYIFYDDISEDGTRELKKLCRFLKVSADHLPKKTAIDRVVNEAPTSTIPEEVTQHLRNYYSKDKSYLETKFNRDLGDWYRG